jgi:hypothetical protein
LENVAILYGHLEYFMYIGDFLRPFGTFCVHLEHFCPVLVSCTKKNLATLNKSAFLSCFFSLGAFYAFSKMVVTVFIVHPSDIFSDCIYLGISGKE